MDRLRNDRKVQTPLPGPTSTQQVRRLLYGGGGHMERVSSTSKHSVHVSNSGLPVKANFDEFKSCRLPISTPERDAEERCFWRFRWPRPAVPSPAAGKCHAGHSAAAGTASAAAAAPPEADGASQWGRPASSMVAFRGMPIFEITRRALGAGEKHKYFAFACKKLVQPAYFN